jgi:hypothetical protein
VWLLRPRLATPFPERNQPWHRRGAKRVIYLFQSGGPSIQELFDHKPLLEQMHGEELPESVRGDQRLTGMTAGQGRLLLAGSHFQFERHGQSGAWVSELMPHTAGIADELCFVNSMYTEAINHDPAITFFQTGSQLPGLPSMGSWLSYGLGSENENLPGFVVMLDPTGGPISGAKNWSSGYMPASYQGTILRSKGAPIIDLNLPEGMTRELQRDLLDSLRAANEEHLAPRADNTDLAARIASYELAYKMQMHAPEAVDLTQEVEARDMVVARRAERGEHIVGSVWDGSDCARLFVAHGLIDPNTGESLQRD